jgi:hypothetical protein
MAHDLCDPGPNGDYPYLPRNADGTLDTRIVPIGIEISGERDRNGSRMRLRMMPRLADGRPVTDVFPLPPGQTPDDILPRNT